MLKSIPRTLPWLCSAAVLFPHCSPAAQTVVFQQGLNDYAGAVDMRLRARDDQDGANSGTLAFDGGDKAYGDADLAYGFFRFDDLFGSGPGQIPPGSQIISARFTLQTAVAGNAQTGGFFMVSALNEPLPVPEEGTIFSAFSNNKGYGGPDFADGHTGRPTGSFSSPWSPAQRIDQGEQGFVDVTDIVRFWAGETAEEPRNHGLIVTQVNGTDAWNVQSSSNGDEAGRPKLEITYLTPEETEALRTKTAVFRQGAPLDEEGMFYYEGTVSAKLQDPTYRGGEAESLDGSSMNLNFLDGFNTTDSPDDQMMIQFDKIFGTDPGQIAPAPLLQIERAVLKLTTGPGGNAYSPGPVDVHQVLTPWFTQDETGAVTFKRWSDFKAPGAETASGPSVENGDIAPALGTLYGLGFDQKNAVDVTAAVRAWAAGAANYGFNVQLGTADGWELHWPGANTEEARPELVVTYSYLPDADGDLMPDEWETANGTNPAAADADGDADGDTLTNLAEYRLGTKANAADTDGDGLRDNVEDGGGVWVSEEKTGTSPLLADTDSDGLSDGVENPSLPWTGAAQSGSDPNKYDSDGDGFPDGAEVAAGSNPASASAIPSYIWTPVMAENFDGASTASTYALMTSSGSYFPEVLDSEEPAGANALRLVNLTASTNNSVAWDFVPTTGLSTRLSFDYRLSADVTSEAADGFGIGFFRTSAYGETGELNPGASPREWEEPRNGGGFPDAVLFSFDIYNGAAEGNNVRVSGPATPGQVLANIIAPFPLNSGKFNRVTITALGSGTSALFTMTIIEDVNGTAPMTHTIFSNLPIPGFDLSQEKVRLIAGGRTGTVLVQMDLDNVKLETAAAGTPVEPEPGDSTFAITGLALDQSGGVPALRITWDSRTGETYTVERSTDLAEWTPASQNIPAAASSAETAWSDPLGNNPPAKVFYRVKLNP